MINIKLKLKLNYRKFVIFIPITTLKLPPFSQIRLVNFDNRFQSENVVVVIAVNFDCVFIESIWNRAEMLVEVDTDVENFQFSLQVMLFIFHVCFENLWFYRVRTRMENVFGQRLSNKSFDNPIEEYVVSCSIQNATTFNFVDVNHSSVESCNLPVSDFQINLKSERENFIQTLNSGD